MYICVNQQYINYPWCHLSKSMIYRVSLIILMRIMKTNLLQILDMCAAPGSKTAQIIEYLHRTENGELPGKEQGHK